MLRHVGRYASVNSNRELIETKSMWSIIELSPYDEEIDEKQENFNALIKCLEEEEHNDLAKELSDLNKKARKKIINYMDKLPRCVFQGDLNDSNILVDENGDFQGLIDFNMFGTEVNINYFLNEAMYYFTKKDFENSTGKELGRKMVEIQNDLLSVITDQYDLSAEEKEIMPYYNYIIHTSFWPNVLLMIRMIKEKKYENKVIDLLQEIVEKGL